MNHKKVGIVLMVLFAVSVLTVVSGVSQEDVHWVRDSAFGVRQRPPVVFNHEEHNEMAGTEDCAICHHEGFDEDGTPLEGDPATECSECHMTGGKDKMDLMRIYHLNCKGCHEERKAGPVQCGECHDEDNVI